MARKGCRTGKQYGTGLMGRTQEHSKLRVDVNLTVYLKLWLPLDENKGGPIFRKVLVTLDLVETRHKSIQLLNNTIRNPAFFYFFDIFILLRSAKGVTTENLSLSKWQTWPVEFSEDCEKCEKTSRIGNSNFGGEFQDSKIVKPAKVRDKQIWNFFWFILIYETLKSEFVCEGYGYFTNRLRIRGQNGPKVGKFCGGGKKLMETVGKRYELDSNKT